jgi:hypothetical protein
MVWSSGYPSLISRFYEALADGFLTLNCDEILFRVGIVGMDSRFTKEFGRVVTKFNKMRAGAREILFLKDRPIFERSGRGGRAVTKKC